MSQPAAEPRDIRTTILFAAAGALLAAATGIVGMSDNPPGLALAYASTAAFLLAAIHPWRRPARWLRFAAVSLVAGFACAILHNFPEILAERMGTSTLLGGAMGVIGVTLFLLAVIVAPAAIVVGLAGSAVALVRRRMQAAPHP